VAFLTLEEIMNKYAAEVQCTAQVVIQAETKEEAQKKIEAMGLASIMETCEDSFWGINHIDSVQTYDKEANRFITA
jgi:hypothetical protein